MAGLGAELAGGSGMNVPAIAIEGLTVVRGDQRVLDDFGLCIERGGITGLLGPSGCGKTTLMRCIVGVQCILRGRVEVLGRAAGETELRRRVAYVTQAPSVYRDLTVEQNLRFFARVLGVGPEAVTRAVGLVGLAGLEGSLGGRLSGGQQSRLSLATALLGEPELFVLDEPTVGLDPLLRDELWNTFHRLADEGATLLISSHVMDEAERCDRLILMREGKVVAHDTPPAILETAARATIGEAFVALIERGEVA